MDVCTDHHKSLANVREAFIFISRQTGPNQLLFLIRNCTPANTLVYNPTVEEELDYFPFGAIMQHQYHSSLLQQLLLHVKGLHCWGTTFSSNWYWWPFLIRANWKLFKCILWETELYPPSFFSPPKASALQSTQRSVLGSVGTLYPLYIVNIDPRWCPCAWNLQGITQYSIYHS